MGQTSMLTNRQREYLEAVVQRYEETGVAVHYTEVAERLHVSKWTAYDLLTLLAKEGFLEVEHQLDRREGFVGRSMVFFYPTQKAYDQLKERRIVPENWEETKKELLGKLAEVQDGGVTLLLKETVAELSKVRSPLLFCARMISALLLGIWAVRQSAKVSVAIGYLLASLATPEITLMLFVGIALGIILRSGRDLEAVSSLRQYVSAYVEQVRKMGEAEQVALLTFIQECAAQLPSR